MNRVYDVIVNEKHLSDLNNPIGLQLSMIGSEKDVLELGSATGYMTRLLSNNKSCRVTSIEFMPESAEQARPYCQKMIIGDLESTQTLSQIESRYDVILAGDVLEHLREPELILRQLRAYLKPNGYWVISVPNIAHWSVRKELLFGRFNFTQRGIMDRTHLHWFTARTLREMIEDTGYRLIRLEAVFTLPFQDTLKLHGLAKQLQRLNIKLGLFGYQLVAQAVLAGPTDTQ